MRSNRQSLNDERPMTIQMMRRMLPMMFHIDANLINARGKLETMNQIAKWADADVILINMSGTSYDEAKAGGNPERTKKANTHIFTLPDEDVGPHDPVYRRIEATLFPGGAKDDNQRNDVRVVFEAAKYGALLITRDGGSKTQPGGMLGNRDKLKDVVSIVSDAEAVELIRKKIQERDEFNRRVAGEFGVPLPEWTGLD